MSMAHPDIWLGAISCGGSRGANLICFPVSHMYFFVGGGKFIAKMDGGPWPDLPCLDPPLPYVTSEI